MSSLPKARGFIALMATIIISLILLVMVVEEGTSGWYARFNILGTEAKEQASSLAEGCADQALAALVTDPTYAGDSTSTSSGGVCHVFPIQFNTPAAGLVTISTQAQVRNSFANLAAVMNMASVHLGSTPSSPTRGTLMVYTHVINDNGGAKAAGDFTENVAASAPSKFLFAGGEGGVAVTMNPGAYSISQNSISGYAQTLSAGCSGTIAAGEVKSCVVTNDDVLTTLTVIANVINNNGGIHPVGDFILYIDGVAKTAGRPYVVGTGVHTVSGTTFAGYTASAWGYNCSASGSITINSGDNKTCIITYDDNPPAAPECADTVMMLDRTSSMFGDSPQYTNHPEWIAGEEAAADALATLYGGVSPLPQLSVGHFADRAYTPSTSGNTSAEILTSPNAQLQASAAYYSNLPNIIHTALANITSTNVLCLLLGNCQYAFTNLAAAITAGNNELNSIRHIAGKQKVLILVSDGDPNEPNGSTPFDTGFFSPAADVQNGSGDLWSSAAGAYADGGVDANDPVAENDRHQFFNFTIPAIPAGAVISGIEARADAWATASNVAGPVTSSAKSPTAALAPNQWTNPTRASASDDSYATSVVNGNQQGYSTFGFAIPSNATITGVGVTTEAKIVGTGSATSATLFSNGSGSDGSWNGSESDVDETGAASCSSGDRIDSTSNNNRESVNIDLSSVPNNSVITSVQILTWDQGSPVGGTYKTYARINGTATDATANLTTTSTGGCNARTQTVDVPDFTKTGSTDFEVGVLKVGGTSVQVGAIRAIVTYIPTTTGSLSVALSSNNGGSYTAAENVTISSAEAAVAPAGNSSSDMWGRPWVPTDFNNGNFALRVQNTSANGSTVSLDQVVVTVYYTVPVPGPVSCQLGVDLSWGGGAAGTWVSDLSSSNEKKQTLTGTEATYPLGNSSDKWGSHNWVIGDFSNANFRARVHAIDPGASCADTAVDHLDWLQMKVHYTQSSDPLTAAYAAADSAKLALTSIFTIHFGDSVGRDLLAKLASGPTANGSHQPGSFNDPGGISSGNTGYISPAAQAADTGGDGNGFEVNPSSVFSDDGASASNIDGAGDRHRFSGYTFNIPPGATINGIQIRTDWWLDNTSGTNSIDVQLSWDGGTNWTSVKNQGTESTSDSNNKTVGSASDTWGRVWSAGDFDPSKFRVRVISNSSVSTRDFFLDWLPVTVYYSVIQENGDGDNFFIAPTSADMAGIFNFIGSQVCPAASAPAAAPAPTTATVLVTTVVVNDNGTGSKVASDFTANVSGTNVSPSSFAGSGSGVSVTVDPGSYSVTETGVAGYTEKPNATCSSALSGAIVAGETRVCTLVNDDIPPPPAPPNLTITTGSFEEVPNPH